MKKCSRRNVAAMALLACGLMMNGSFLAKAEEKTISNGVLIEGVDVSGMTADEAVKAVKNKVQELGEATVTLMMGDTPITATFNNLGLEWENKEIIDEVKNLGTTGNIVQRYKDQKDLEHQNKEYDITFTTNDDKTRSFVEGCSIYNSEPVNGTIYPLDDGTPTVEGGTDGLTLRVEDSVKAVKDAFENWNGGDLTIDLQVDRVSPDITEEELSLVKDVLGTATTDYSASSSARATNVQNGCAKINGSLIFPGEEFSVTQAVIPFTAENGYEPAPSYEENKVVDSYGGGICQVSTTLYNAVLKSELDVTARSNHTMIVTYVDPSKDAAIAEGVMDLAFVNNTDAPIYISGYTYGGTITFTIYGHETRPSNRSIEFVSNVTSTTEPSGIQLTADTAQNVGYINQVQSPHTGYTAELWKNIYEDGNLVDTVQINSSTYQAVGTIYDVGVATSNSYVSSAIYTAIGNNDLSTVQAIISGAYNTQPSTSAPTTTTDQTTTDQTTTGQTTGTTDAGTTTDGTATGTGEVVIVDPPEE